MRRFYSALLCAALFLLAALPARATITVNEWLFVNNVIGQPPASPVYCGWECGFRVDRNTVGMSGGTFQNTNHAFMVWNRVGEGVQNREFSAMVLTESNQTVGEAVSIYTKTEKRGSAPGWAGVFELNDHWNQPGAAVGIEVDLFTKGAATDPLGPLDANGGRVRIGVDIVGGDESAKAGEGNSGAEGSLGLNIYATSTTPWFRWLNGAQIADYKNAGLILRGNKTSSNWTPERAVRIMGDHVVGLDFSGGNFQSVIRLKEGQAYSFDAYDDKVVRYLNGRLEFLQSVCNPQPCVKKAVMAIDYATGAVRAKQFITTNTP